MLRPGNVATPATALTVTVPVSVPLPGLVPIARVTAFVAVVTTFPCESSMVTWTGGVIDAVAVTLVGCTVKASFDGGPAVILKALLAAWVRPVALPVNV